MVKRIKLKKYQIEFSDKITRRSDSMPFNVITKAKTKRNAIKKVITKFKKEYPNNKIRIEGAFRINEGIYYFKKRR